MLFLDVEQGEGLQRLLALAAAVRQHFKQRGLLLDAGKAFVPHVTIAKLSKLAGPPAWQRSKRASTNDRAPELQGRHGEPPPQSNSEPAATATDEEMAQAAPPLGPADCPGAASELPADQAGSSAAAAVQQAERPPTAALMKIPAEAYEAHVAVEVGEVTAPELQLCSMQHREPGEYYPLVAVLCLSTGSVRMVAGAEAGGEGAVSGGALGAACGAAGGGEATAGGSGGAEGAAGGAPASQ